jgi:hypothetical protein
MLGLESAEDLDFSQSLPLLAVWPVQGGKEGVARGAKEGCGVCVCVIIRS